MALLSLSEIRLSSADDDRDTQTHKNWDHTGILIIISRTRRRATTQAALALEAIIVAVNTLAFFYVALEVAKDETSILEGNKGKQ